jgi:hypothetical protein
VEISYTSSYFKYLEMFKNCHLSYKDYWGEHNTLMTCFKSNILSVHAYMNTLVLGIRTNNRFVLFTIISVRTTDPFSIPS